jgi:hypothetical protein
MIVYTETLKQSKSKNDLQHVSCISSEGTGGNIMRVMGMADMLEHMLVKLLILPESIK